MDLEPDSSRQSDPDPEHMDATDPDPDHREATDPDPGHGESPDGGAEVTDEAEHPETGTERDCEDPKATKDSVEGGVDGGGEKGLLEDIYESLALHDTVPALQTGQGEDPYEEKQGEEKEENEEEQEKGGKEEVPNLAEICAAVLPPSSAAFGSSSSLNYVAGLGKSLYSSLRAPSSLSPRPSPPSSSSSRDSTPSLALPPPNSALCSLGERRAATLVFCWGKAGRGQLGQVCYSYSGQH